MTWSHHESRSENILDGLLALFPSGQHRLAPVPTPFHPKMLSGTKNKP